MSVVVFDVDDNDPAVVTVEEAAKFLRVSTWSIYKLVQADELKAVHVGRRIRIPTAALRRFAAGEVG